MVVFNFFDVLYCNIFSRRIVVEGYHVAFIESCSFCDGAMEDFLCSKNIQIYVSVWRSLLAVLQTSNFFVCRHNNSLSPFSTTNHGTTWYCTSGYGFLASYIVRKK